MNDTTPNPSDVSRRRFLAAAAAHRALDVRARFDRAAVLDEVAARLGATVGQPDLITFVYGGLQFFVSAIHCHGHHKLRLIGQELEIGVDVPIHGGDFEQIQRNGTGRNLQFL